MTQAAEFRVVTWNIEWFLGMRPRADEAVVAKHIEDVQEAITQMNPDILVMQEIIHDVINSCGWRGMDFRWLARSEEGEYPQRSLTDERQLFMTSCLETGRWLKRLLRRFLGCVLKSPVVFKALSSR
jgi:hypothetical protein